MAQSKNVLSKIELGFFYASTLLLSNFLTHSGLAIAINISPQFVKLNIQPSKAQAEFENGGWVDNGTLGKALYLSRTRQIVQEGSTIELNGETINVSGTAWEDHQLTNLSHLPGKTIKWNWFAILLKDGTEVMAYQIEDARSGALLKNYAGHVLNDGQVINLDGQFRVSEDSS